MPLKDKISADYKQAMITGDKPRAEILASIRSAILYKEVAENKRDSGLDDDSVILVLKKEKKTRLEAAEMYKQAGSEERVDQEEYQAGIISEYLPEEASDEQIKSAISQSLSSLGITNFQKSDFGKIMGKVKKIVPNADSSKIAQILSKWS